MSGLEVSHCPIHTMCSRAVLGVALPFYLATRQTDILLCCLFSSGGDHGTGHLTSVQCTGFEDLLDYCPHSLATTNCSHLVTINCSTTLSLSSFFSCI